MPFPRSTVGDHPDTVGFTPHICKGNHDEDCDEPFRELPGRDAGLRRRRVLVVRRRREQLERRQAQQPLELLDEARLVDLLADAGPVVQAADQDGLGRQVEQETSFTVSVSVDSTRLPHGVEQLAYRTIKELLANAAKHSQAQRVTVEVAAGPAAVSCMVADDGRGFDAAAVADARRGFHIGLDAAADRVQSAGGRLEITSTPGEGAEFHFLLPR